MNRLFALGVTAFILMGCERAGLRNGHDPGKLEVVDNAKVFHLANGIFIEEMKNGNKHYFLIESGVAGYELTETGVEIEMKGDGAGTFSTTPAPKGYVAAWITLLPGEGPELTRFQIEDENIAKLLKEFTATTTVRDVYNLKR